MKAAMAVAREPAPLLMVETRNNLQSASVRTYTFFTTG
jgi:hypothetical protein